MNVRCLIAMVACLITLQVGASGEAKKSNDAKNIQGTWKPVSIEFEGDAPETPEDKAALLKNLRLKFTATEVVLSMEGDKKQERLTYRLYPDRPKAMDLILDSVVGFNGVPRKVQQVVPCIYELKGDKLTICSADAAISPESSEKKADPAQIERARPTEFKAAKTHSLKVFQRVK